jgi:hypothetical protein
MKSVQELMFEKDEKLLDALENSNVVFRYELRFLSSDESQAVHRVEVKKLNLQDVIRHLRQGDSVLITPEFQEDINRKKEPSKSPWYFAHS